MMEKALVLVICYTFIATGYSSFTLLSLIRCSWWSEKWTPLCEDHVRLSVYNAVSAINTIWWIFM